MMPHLMNECLDELKVKDKNEWPKVNKKYLKMKILMLLFKLMEKKEAYEF